MNKTPILIVWQFVWGIFLFTYFPDIQDVKEDIIMEDLFTKYLTQNKRDNAKINEGNIIR